MSDVKRYYVGVNTKCLGGIGLVEMTDLYREATGFDGLVMGKDYDALKAEIESLRADAKRYRWMRDEAIDPGTVIDKKVGISEIGGFPIWEYRCGTELDDAIDAAISSPENH